MMPRQAGIAGCGCTLFMVYADAKIALTGHDALHVLDSSRRRRRAEPLWGSCTLAICKPQIRRVAQPGDWVAGFGAKRSWDGLNHEGTLVYDREQFSSGYDQKAISRP